MSSLILFCLVVLPSAKRVMLKSLTTTVETSFSLFNSASFLLHGFDAVTGPYTPPVTYVLLLNCPFDLFHPRSWCEICYYLVLTVILTFLCFLFAWHLFFLPSFGAFNLSMSFKLKHFLCRQYIAGSYFIHSDIPYLLMSV